MMNKINTIINELYRMPPYYTNIDLITGYMDVNIVYVYDDGFLYYNGKIIAQQSKFNGYKGEGTIEDAIKLKNKEAWKNFFDYYTNNKQHIKNYYLLTINQNSFVMKNKRQHDFIFNMLDQLKSKAVYKNHSLSKSSSSIMTTCKIIKT